MTQKIKTFNAIAEKGLNILQEKKFEVSDGLSDPDAIILRSHKLKKEDFGNNLKAIARAGAGVNNILSKNVLSLEFLYLTLQERMLMQLKK